MILWAAMSQTKKRRPLNEEMTLEVLMECLGSVPDPRMARTRRHSLRSILALSLIAVICGADSFVAIEQFGRAREAWLKTFLDLPHGIPSHDTLGRVFALMGPKSLQKAFRTWMAEVSRLSGGDVVAIDGKTLRRSFDSPGVGFVHMVSAWSASNRVVLGQVKTDEKSNEITAIPRLLESLNLTNCTVTIDAMGCQRDIAKKIVEKEADYLLAVKDNHPTLAADVGARFEAAREDPLSLQEMDFHETEGKGHGRLEKRRCWTSGLLDCISHRENWEGLESLVLIESERTVDGKTSLEHRYYISSKKDLSAVEALDATRSHWGIENGLHWVLDVAFREDDCRVRAGCAAENFAVIRHFALNLLKSVKGTKVGIKNRRLRAGWDQEFLLSVMSSLS